MNERIRAREVRLIGPDSKLVGVVTLLEALRQARVAELDLVEVNASATPPVCRIMDYGKYQYDHDKREHESRKKQRKVETKGVRISFKMGQNDRHLRRTRAEKFLAEGHKVRVELILRGRERSLGDRGRQMLEVFLRELEPLASIEEPITRSPRALTTIIAPRGSSSEKS